MQVFIQVYLGLKEHYAFAQPVLQSIKKELPAVVALDIDAASDQMLVTQACRLVQEAEQAVVYFKVAEPNASLGAAFRLVEEVIRKNEPALILIEGTHLRLAGIIKSRPYLLLTEVMDSNLIPNQISTFYQQKN